MRYLAYTDEQRKEMLGTIGVSKVDDLFSMVDDKFVQKSPIQGLPMHKSELEVERHLSALAAKNKSASDASGFFLGAGNYRHHVPASVDHIIQRAEFLTSYTPYQPEISQGTLAVIFQFQSYIAKLTGMEVANASLYDGATGLAEAMLMAVRISRGKKKRILFENKANPDYVDVCKTFADLNEIEMGCASTLDENTAAIIVSYPDFNGEVTSLEKLNEIRQKCDEVGALMIVVVSEIVALGMLQAPKMADIVVGEASSLGVTLNFGGPLLGFFACKKQFVRQMPGRLCGMSVDEDGKEAYVLTLNAREQHIRRDKATSNICSNQGLCATAFTIHASLLGEIGIKKLALQNHQKACFAYDLLAKVKGVKILNKTFFNEFTVEFDGISAEKVNKKLLENNIIGGFVFENKMTLAFTEMNLDSEIENLAQVLNKILN